MTGPTIRTLLVVFVLLVLLLGLTVAVAEVDLGRGNLLAATTIASIKALLIVLYFMHVRYSEQLTWIIAGGACLWMVILVGLALSDYLTRGWTAFS